MDDSSQIRVFCDSERSVDLIARDTASSGYGSLTANLITRLVTNVSLVKVLVLPLTLFWRRPRLSPSSLIYTERKLFSFVLPA